MIASRAHSIGDACPQCARHIVEDLGLDLLLVAPGAVIEHKAATAVPRRVRAIATTYSADEPERLRGPQHDAAYCDEVASWRYPEAYDMLLFGLRLGDDPRVVVTTTPKPVKIDGS
jgi:hypothetical protein